MDVTNPKVYEIMAKVYKDLLEMAGGHTAYFQTFNDEWWHKSRTQTDAVYKGQTRQNLFYKIPDGRIQYPERAPSAHDYVDRHAASKT